MPLLESLCIEEVITERELDMRKAVIRKRIKQVAWGARTYANGLRRRMNEADQKVSAAKQIPTAVGRDNQPADVQQLTARRENLYRTVPEVKQTAG